MIIAIKSVNLATFVRSIDLMNGNGVGVHLGRGLSLHPHKRLEGFKMIEMRS